MGKIDLLPFICKTPMKVNKESAMTGAQTARIKGILSVCPKAKESSLK